MKSLVKFIVVLFLLCVVVIKSDAQTAPKISIQGTLKDANGAAVDDGTYTVEFRLYTVESGGTIEWFETASIESAGGIYSHYLGSITPLVATVFDQTLYLGIKVGAYELTPRTELTYAPYTFASNTALSAVKVICSGAVGDVKYSILNPTQFALENGDCWTPMNGASMFGTKLATILGTNTKPNASGLFLRAQEYTEGNDPDRSTGSAIATVQNHATALPNAGLTAASAGNHTHTGTTSADGYGREGEIVSSGTGAVAADDKNFHAHTLNINAAGDHTHSIIGGDSETRPKNMNLYVYIRVN